MGRGRNYPPLLESFRIIENNKTDILANPEIRNLRVVDERDA